MSKIKKPKLRFLRKDPFGKPILLKRFLIFVLGGVAFIRLNVVNRLKVEGMPNLFDLPRTGVLFISNHQTYYTDVIAFYHIFGAAKWRFKRFVRVPVYLLAPNSKIYYVAAEETMLRSGLLPKILAVAGAITVRRHWRESGKNIKRGVDTSAPDKIRKALEVGWVVNFPQGTTKPFSPVRKGTAHIIKNFNPIVVPIVIDGFRRAFDKKGLYYKKRGATLQVKIKEPLQFKADDSLEYITQTIAEAIEQNPESRNSKLVV